MEVIFSHEIEFTLTKNVSVSDVAASLIANEELLLSVGKVLEECFPELIVEKIVPRFISATTYSPLKEALAAGILLTFQDDLKREVPKLIEGITGAHIDPNYTTLVTVEFLVVVIYGIEKAWELFRKPKLDTPDATSPRPITHNFGTILNVGGDIIGIPPAELAGAVDRAFPANQRRALAKRAVRFIQPAKEEPGAVIIGAGLMITPEAIEAAPSSLIS